MQLTLTTLPRIRPPVFTIKHAESMFPITLIFSLLSFFEQVQAIIILEKHALLMKFRKEKAIAVLGLYFLRGEGCNCIK